MIDQTFTIEEIARFYREVGEPCDLGCGESDVEKWINFCTGKYPYKGVCTVKKWAVIECRCSENEVLIIKEKLGLQPFVLNANHVMWDSQGRWREGNFCCSFFLIELEESCLFITKNTCYILVGNGHRKSISPTMLLAIMEGLSF
ncbi:MAG: hypothetical protein AAGC78_06480 [Cellvibrio sp.]|uniref:DUF6957 family protein n=1 Tax=Cellvibrio sp. TaxID=1965322 RepID=UPI00319F963A